MEREVPPQVCKGCEAWSGLDQRVREQQDPGVVGCPFFYCLIKLSLLVTSPSVPGSQPW